MKNQKFTTKLYAGIGILFLFTSAIVILAIAEIKEISKVTSTLYEHPLAVSNSVRDINICISAIQRNMREIELTEDIEQVHCSELEIKSYQEIADKSFGIVIDKFLGDKKIPIETYAAFKSWEPLRDEIIQLKLSNNPKALSTAINTEKKHVNMLFETTKVMTDFAKNKADEVFTSLKAKEKSNIAIIWALFSLVLLLSLLVAIYTSQSISKPVNKFILQLEKLYKKEDIEIRKNIPEHELFELVVDELTLAFNKLEDFNHQLEQQVMKRTKELQDSQEQLINQNEEFSSLNREYLKQNIDLKRAIQKAEESDKLKSAFLANMSHEIRTPMNGIIGFANLLQQEELSAEMRSKYIDIINSSGNQLLTLISDIIDISKIEAGQVELSLKEENINHILDKLYSQFEIELIKKNKKNVALNLVKGLQNSECNIKADGIRLTQVLMNLIGNAIKFTDSGSIEFGYRRTDKYNLLFFVKDTGIGLSEIDQKIIFDRFRQANNGDKRNISGTGLGLSISQGLITLMGGKIWVQSKLGEGSTFFFTVPFQQVSQNIPIPEMELQQTPNFDWSGKTILVVDDMDLVYYYIKEVLKNTRAKHIHAKTGQEAVRLATENPDIDIVLMDIELPDIDGFEATKIIKKNRNIPIIAQTAYAMQSDKEKAIAAGCDGYIAKPLNKSHLFELIEKNLS